jgi:hypothetical protein
MMDKVPKNKFVSVNICHAVFSLWNFLTLEAGPTVCTKMLVWSYYSVLRNIQQISHDDLAMQALVRIHIIRFRVIWIDMVQFGASFMNLT